MNDSQLALVAKKIADYLATHEEQQNEEQYLLQGLWKVGNEKEQHQLAHMHFFIPHSRHSHKKTPPFTELLK
ncbi:DUF3243 domain-containing protein [Bacillus megaterium]|nr:DUF3243 domain-containing protein [Priestia megaterium]NGY81205.1 DUF3243 domain-containing protein [Priestia megaterium]